MRAPEAVQLTLRTCDRVAVRNQSSRFPGQFRVQRNVPNRLCLRDTPAGSLPLESRVRVHPNCPRPEILRTHGKRFLPSPRKRGFWEKLRTGLRQTQKVRARVPASLQRPLGRPVSRVCVCMQSLLLLASGALGPRVLLSRLGLVCACPDPKRPNRGGIEMPARLLLYL